ncbi:hypothetical protein KFK09_010766 [Dendrobium nobile]|uniref:Uncharacterized protein n=1 Tax=Dendrobium nobile TaxID=94219 RepID=A0A8T3BAY2_DENNO|nr:hypothetical protein KFK09_010766 [Dendrobium nobile]
MAYLACIEACHNTSRQACLARVACLTRVYLAFVILGDLPCWLISASIRASPFENPILHSKMAENFKMLQFISNGTTFLFFPALSYFAPFLRS